MKTILNLLAIVSLILLIGISLAHATTKKEFEDAVEKAGLSALPSFIELSDNKISITFPSSMGNKKFHFNGDLDTDALANGEFKFESSPKNKVVWNNAFGMDFLDLNGLQLNLDIKKGEEEIALKGFLGGAFRKHGKNLEVDIGISVEDKKLTDFTIDLPDTTLSLHLIPEFRRIPGIANFSLKHPIISRNALGGTVEFLKETVDTAVFYDKNANGWVLAMQFEKAVTLAQLTGHKKGFLKYLGLPQMRLILATHKISTAYDELPQAAQNFFKVDGNLPEGDMTIKRGVNVIAAFDPALASKGLQKSLKSMGLGSTVLEVDGVVHGMFAGSPAIELTVDIDTPSNHGFPFLKTNDTKAEFFIKLSKEEGDLGFRIAVLMSQGKGHDDLEFDVDFGLKETEGNLEVQVAGAMKGDWDNAAGIKGLTIENPFMSVGINETGSFDMLIDGTVIIGSEKVRVATDLILSPEALGLPTAFAFAGKINKLDFNDLVTLAKKHAKQKNGGMKKMDAELKDVAFAFMTPGASLPGDLEEELNISGSGMALKATLLINKKELGTAKGYASTDGLLFEGKLDPFKLGPLDLKDDELSIEAGPKVDPKFAMSGDIELFKNFEETYQIDLEPKHFTFSSETKFGGAFDLQLEAESDGLSFKSDNDFEFDAALSADYNKAFHKLVIGSLNNLKKADKQMSKAQNDVKNAEKKIKGLNEKTKKEKAKAKKAFDHAVKKIDDAKNKVNSLKKTISYNKKKAHDLDRKARSDAKHFKFGKSAKEGSEEAAVKTAIISEEAALKTANWALNQAKKSVKIVPVDMAPKVVELKTELGTAEAGLKIAEEALKDAKAVNGGVEAALKAINKGLSAFKINRIGAAGSLKGITSGGKEGKRPVLVIDVTIHNKHHVYRESITSVKHEFEKLAKEIAKEAAKEILKAFEK
ncbi:MAG: hypothetical protein GY699_15685 [Desulfobacteraceae bacterium]|nr:hypothetical protein [Desulfobacteraceae bacterium]